MCSYRVLILLWCKQRHLSREEGPYLSECSHREVPVSSWGCTLPKDPQGLDWPRSVVKLDPRQKQRTRVMSSHCGVFANVLSFKKYIYSVLNLY
jgi:hypothetical protein